LNVNILKEISELFVVDITGKALQRFEPNVNQNFAIDLNGYATGIYFINAFYQGRWYTTKFIINY
jgi:hypothetical protein